MTAKESVDKITTEIIQDPVKKRFFTILNDKNYKKENYIKEKLEQFQVKKDDIIILLNGTKAKIIKNTSNSEIQVQLFKENGEFSDIIEIVSKSEIEKIVNVK